MARVVAKNVPEPRGDEGEEAEVSTILSQLSFILISYHNEDN
jgi:hypothetical protein